MSSTPQELPPSIYEVIKEHCAAGDELAESSRFEDAVAEYQKAWELIPEPRTAWNASTWVLGAVADACFLGGYKTSAREALEYAMACPGGIGNPFLHMRLGQVLFDAGDLDSSADELIRAYMVAGSDIFRNEDERYLTFRGTRAQL